MNRFLGAVALGALVLAGTAPAYADSAMGTGAGTQSDPFVVTSGSMTAGTEYTLAFPTAGTQSVRGNFTYSYFFQLASTAILDGITASASTTYNFGGTVGRVQNVDFTSFNLSGVTGTIPEAGPKPGYIPQVDYTLAAGTTYELIVTGTTLKDARGNFTTGAFNGNLTVDAVSAVPLPPSVALFGTALLGVGAFGVARRKKAAASAA